MKPQTKTNFSATHLLTTEFSHLAYVVNGYRTIGITFSSKEFLELNEWSSLDLTSHLTYNDSDTRTPRLLVSADYCYFKFQLTHSGKTFVWMSKAVFSKASCLSGMLIS